MAKEIPIGTEMPDGTIYAGESPTKHKSMYLAPEQGQLVDFDEAAQFAKNLEVGGKKDFFVPDRAELGVLWDNSKKGALKGIFDKAAYWSSEGDSDKGREPGRDGSGYALSVLRDGEQGRNVKIFPLYVRCIRYGA